MINFSSHHYEIRKHLTTDRVGFLYQVHDHHLDRDVVMRRFRVHETGAMDRRWQRKFHEIITTCAKMEHRLHVRLFDAGEDDGGPFMVTQRLQGPTLGKRLIGEQTLELWEAILLAKQLTEALTPIHELKQAHSSLSLDSVISEPRLCGRPHFILQDFGLKALTRNDSNLCKKYRYPHFTAPEQDRDETSDHQTDYFQIGHLIFTALVGLKPYRKLCKEGKTPSSLPSLSEYLPKADKSVIAALDKWVTNMTHKDKAQRPSNADEVLAALPHCPQPLQPIHIDKPKALGRINAKPHPMTKPVPLAQSLYQSDHAPKDRLVAVTTGTCYQHLHNDSAEPKYPSKRVCQLNMENTPKFDRVGLGIAVAIGIAVSVGLTLFSNDSMGSTEAASKIPQSPAIYTDAP